MKSKDITEGARLYWVRSGGNEWQDSPGHGYEATVVDATVAHWFYSQVSKKWEYQKERSTWRNTMYGVLVKREWSGRTLIEPASLVSLKGPYDEILAQVEQRAAEKRKARVGARQEEERNALIRRQALQKVASLVPQRHHSRLGLRYAWTAMRDTCMEIDSAMLKAMADKLAEIGWTYEPEED